MARTHKRRKSGTGEFDPTRWAHATFGVFALMAAWMFGLMIEDVWGWAWSVWPVQVGRPSELWARGLGLVVGLALIVWLWTRERYFKFISDVAVEVSQIVWPTRAETRAATIVVVIITIICSLILFAMDTFWSRTTDWLYGL
jgi:preprotein translocase subunit SecE